jgi:hypothetical protein
MHRIAIIAALAACVGTLGSTAHACGYWHIDDDELGLRAVFLINQTKVSMTSTMAGNVLLGRDYFPDSLEIDGEAILHIDREVGQIREDTAFIGDELYALEFNPASEDGKCGVGSLIRVWHDDRLIIAKRLQHDDTLACSWPRKGSPRNSMRERLILYLIWREQLLDDVRQRSVTLPADREVAARELVADLQQKGAYRRMVNASALAGLGIAALPTVTEQLGRDNRKRVRHALVHALLGIARSGPLDEQSTDALIDLANHRNRDVRTAAAQALSALGAPDE